MSKPEQEPLLDIARGDAARSRQLRSSLRVLRERTDNPQFRKLLDDVLAGRTGLRDAARTPLFDQVVSPGVQQTVERLREMPEEEKQRRAAEAEAQLERFREEAESSPNRREPPADDDEPGDGYLRPSW
jgi:hypothetical protein